MIVGGSVKTIVERVYRLGEASEALRHLTEDRRLAKSSWPGDRQGNPTSATPRERTAIANHHRPLPSALRFSAELGHALKERSNPISSIPHNKAAP